MLPELQGRVVTLRQLQDGDVDVLVRILSQPEVSRWWEGYDRSRVVDELVAEGDGGSFAVLLGDGEVVGMIQYYEQDDPDYRHAGIDIFVDPAHTGMGIGRDAILTLARYLTGTVGHHRLTIDPSVQNQRAIAVFRSLGFREVGVMRRYERRADGTWGDNMLLELMVEDLPDA